MIMDNFTSTEIEKVISISYDPVVIACEEGKITHANSAALNLFDYDISEAVGMPLELLIPEKLRTRHERNRAHYFREMPRARPMGTGLHLLGRKRDGSEFPMDVSLVPIVVDSKLHALANIRDKTAITTVQDLLEDIKPTFEQISFLITWGRRIGMWLVPLVAAQAIIYVVQFIMKLFGH